MVIRAEFAEWTADGLLRAPAFKGIEPQRDPATVVREDAVAVARIVRRARPMGERGGARRPTCDR